MRPCSLSLQAFGAYAGLQRFNLEELGAHRLFLIHGPTGAGKTTLLDAICFALFGESSGAERDGAGMRSHHAEPTSETWVELEFALGEARYRLRRSPAQRTERRGRSAERLPEAELHRLTEAGPELLASKLREVNERVSVLLGYTAAEFRQVVLLPQGRFRELLSAGPKERQEILATLFRSAAFRRVQDRLAEMARTAKAAMEQASTARATLLAEAGAASAEAAEATGLALAETAAARTATAATAETTLQASLARRDAARLAAERLRERDDAALALAELEAQAPARHARAMRLAQARQAATLSGEAAAAARAAAHRAKVHAVASTTAREESERRHAAAQAALADADSRSRAQAEESAQADILSALTAQAEALSFGEAALREAGTAHHRAATALDCAVAKRDAARQAAEATQARHQDLVALAERWPERRAAAERAELSRRDAARLVQAEATAARLAGAAQGAAQAAAAAEAGLRQAEAAEAEAERLAWESQAASLAHDLAEGRPCPVCGGTHHPAPAQPPGRLPGDLAALRARLAETRVADATARQAATRAAAEATAAATARDDLATRVAEAGPPDEGAPAAAAASEAAAKALPGAAEALAAAIAALAASESSASAARLAAEAAHGERERLQGAQAALEAAVPPQARDAGRLARLIAEARARAGSLARGLQADHAELAAAAAALEERRHAEAMAHEAMAQAEGQAGEAAARLDAASRAAGFADAAALAAARLEPADLAALDATVRQDTEAMAAAEDRHARATGAAEGLAPPDLPAMELAAAEAGAAARAARDAATEAQAEAKRFAALRGRIAAAEAAWVLAGQRHHRLDRMSRVLRGDNRLRRDLEGHVLAGLLEETLEAANRHLGRIFHHRYRLALREDPANRKAAAGLDIEVWDDWTGVPRAAGTLSGGEGFCAALALALGLSEVVQTRAGAVRIEALFVDEGFGTLDAEALDQALEVLAGLDGGGRLIGIISHVAELRARIPAQLRVTPGPRGSSARFAFA